MRSPAIGCESLSRPQPRGENGDRNSSIATLLKMGGIDRQARRPATREAVRPLHVLTLTPFYPSEGDDGAGCFVAEPLDALAQAGVLNTVFAMRPMYRGKLRARESGVPAQWLR